MKPAIVISGLSQISALGQGKASLRAALDGHAQPRIVPRKVRTRDGDVEILVYQAPEVILPADIPESVKRRMPRISKMCFSTVLEALSDAYGEKWRDAMGDPTRIGLVVGTAFGALDLGFLYEKRLILENNPSPTLFSSSIHNAIASHLSISLGIQGPTSTVVSIDQTAFGAFRLAYDWIGQGRVDHVLLAISDEVSEFHGYARAHASRTQAQKLVPESDECTAILGEGAATFLLSRAALAPKSYCELKDVRLYSETCPESDRYLAAAFGMEGQWSMYRDWLGRDRPATCLSPLYGSFVTGSALDIAAGALLVKADGLSTTCVQLTKHGEAQTVSLEKI